MSKQSAPLKPEHNQLNIAILAGGNSVEKEISQISANAVYEAIKDDYKSVEIIPFTSKIAQDLANFSPDIVLPYLHGTGGEDGCIQGLLEVANYPYLGPSVLSGALSMHKYTAKKIFRAHDCPVTQEIYLPQKTPINQVLALIEERKFGNHLMVKANNQGSSLGASPVTHLDELPKALEHAFSVDNEVLIEPFIVGREIAVGILETSDQNLSPFSPIEIQTPEGSWYDFEHRYVAGKSTHVFPEDLSTETLEKLQKYAATAHQSVKCRHLSRCDFIVTDQEEIYLLEINTIPGMTPTSLYPEGAAAIGYDFHTLITHFVALASMRNSQIYSPEPNGESNNLKMA